MTRIAIKAGVALLALVLALLLAIPYLIAPTWTCDRFLRCWGRRAHDIHHDGLRVQVRVAPRFFWLFNVLFPTSRALTMGRTVLTRDAEVAWRVRTLRHEMRHAFQFRAAPRKYVPRYTWHYPRTGWRRHPMEVEARAAEDWPIDSETDPRP